jgi:hypothetical protein
MTTERLRQQRDQLAKESEQIKANLIATGGAIQILDKLIAEEEKSEKPDA